MGDLQEMTTGKAVFSLQVKITIVAYQTQITSLAAICWLGSVESAKNVKGPCCHLPSKNCSHLAVKVSSCCSHEILVVYFALVLTSQSAQVTVHFV